MCVPRWYSIALYRVETEFHTFLAFVQLGAYGIYQSPSWQTCQNARAHVRHTYIQEEWESGLCLCVYFYFIIIKLLQALIFPLSFEVGRDNVHHPGLDGSETPAAHS
jgi:hypothetical protein